MDMFDEMAPKPAGDDFLNPAPAGEVPAPAVAFDPMAALGGGGDNTPAADSSDPFSGMAPAASGGEALQSTISQASHKKIKEMEEAQTKRSQERQDREAVEKKQKREKATKELAEWYAERKAKAAKKAAANRKEEAEWIALQNENKPKNPWERVSQLISEPPTTKDSVATHDISRFKQLLIQLKASTVPN